MKIFAEVMFVYYSEKNKILLSIADKALNSVIGHIEKNLSDGNQFVNPLEYKSENFYEGNKFVHEPGKNAAWKLGYSCASLVPDDIKEHEYYLGGYFSPDNDFCNKVENVIDDMRVRCVAFDDSSDRGINIFAVVDCIGISNADIRRIRAKFSESFDRKICSVNVCSTHTHSCIDTEGLWSGGIRKILRNLKLKKQGKNPEQGIDEHYISFLSDTVCDAMMKACESMTEGTLKYCAKDIGDRYFQNKNRPSATATETKLTRLAFIPFDKNVTPTIIASIAAHPDVAGLPTKTNSGREVSGDYIYYFGELVSQCGYNMMFFNGAICAIYMARGATNDGVPMEFRYEQSARFGRELARITLSMTMTKEEIERDDILSDRANVETEMKDNPEYTLWYENHEPVTETEVKPYFNIRLREVLIEVLNPIIILAGKLDLTNFRVMSQRGKKFSIYSEIGYFEFGDSMKGIMVPGEYCCDLLKGGKSLTADGSYSGRDFGHPCLWDIFGENTIAMGLANDEVGYIVPDNDYVLSDFKNHYHEEIGLGCRTASAIADEFVKLKQTI